jgi:hypothetical protein
VRACFLGQNICALGNGIAIVRAKPLSQEPWVPLDDETLDVDHAAPNVGKVFAFASQDVSRRKPR